VSSTARTARAWRRYLETFDALLARVSPATLYRLARRARAARWRLAQETNR